METALRNSLMADFSRVIFSEWKVRASLFTSFSHCWDCVVEAGGGVRLAPPASAPLAAAVSGGVRGKARRERRKGRSADRLLLGPPAPAESEHATAATRPVPSAPARPDRESGRGREGLLGPRRAPVAAGREVPSAAVRRVRSHGRATTHYRPKARFIYSYGRRKPLP